MTLWQHQKDALEFVKDKEGSLLWHGMSAGKSYTTINIFDVLNTKLALILCPKVVVKTWKKIGRASCRERV